MDINSINIKTESHIVTPESFDVGSAVGVDKRYWFIAIVKNNTEKSAAQKLHKAGYDCFVATQKDVRYGAPDGAYLSTVWSSLPLYLYIVQSVSAEL